MLAVEIRFLELVPVNINAPVPQLYCFTWQSDYPLHITLVRIVRIPENDDVAPLQMAPTDTLYSVIDKLIYEEPFPVVKLRKHGSSLNNDRLHEEYPDEDKDDDDQKHITKKPQPFGPETLSRFSP
jgi:hypothetical protein